MVKVISLIKNQEQESPFYELSLNAHAHREQSTAKKRRKSYFDSTSDLFFHICTKMITVLVQI